MLTSSIPSKTWLCLSLHSAVFFLQAQNLQAYAMQRPWTFMGSVMTMYDWGKLFTNHQNLMIYYVPLCMWKQGTFCTQQLWGIVRVYDARECQVFMEWRGVVCVAKLFSDNPHTHRMLRQWWGKNVCLKFLQYHAYSSGDRIERSLHSPKGLVNSQIGWIARGRQWFHLISSLQLPLPWPKWTEASQFTSWGARQPKYLRYMNCGELL